MGSLASRRYRDVRMTGGNGRMHRVLLTAVVAALAVSSLRAQSRDTVVAWRIAPQPIFRVGGSDATDTVAQFSRFPAALRVSDGRVVVLEGDETRWFDASGKYLYTSSRRGRGPGEIQYATGIVRMTGDSIAIEQRRPMKRVVIAPSGRFAREEIVDDQKYRGLRRWAECVEQFLPDLSRLACVRFDTTTPRPADPGPGLLRDSTQFVRVSVGLDTVVALGRDMGLEQFGVAAGGRTQFFMHPFHARSFVAAGGTPLRIAIASNPDYRIQIWRPDGVLERTLTRANARRAPTAKEKADATAAMTAAPRLGPPRPGAADRAKLMEQVPVPTQLAAVTDLAVAPGGEVLVGREGQLPGQPSTIIDVFNRAGSFIGILRLPPRFKLLDVGTDYVLGRRLDDDDVAVIEVYRLIKGA
jgi:hypothetical protein